MGIVPTTRVGKLNFYEARIAPWAANAAAIGVLPAAVTALDGLAVDARKAYNDMEALRNAAKAATQVFYESIRALHSGPGAGQDMIQAIRVKAQTTNNPNVYALAQIPPPATPSTSPPPGTPSNFAVVLLQNGAIELRWKCNNPSGTQGTIYEVMRRFTLNGPFTFIGASGTRSFVDETIPTGSAPATYQITAVRSTQRGNPAQFTVSFGVGGVGGLGISIAGVSEGEGGVKLVA